MAKFNPDHQFVFEKVTSLPDCANIVECWHNEFAGTSGVKILGFRVGPVFQGNAVENSEAFAQMIRDKLNEMIKNGQAND